MKRKFRLLTVFLLAFLLAGCGNKIPPSIAELATASGQTAEANAKTEQAAGADAKTGQEAGADAKAEQAAGADAKAEQAAGADAKAEQAAGTDAKAGQTAGADAGTGQTAEADADKDSGGIEDTSDPEGSTAASDKEPDSGLTDDLADLTEDGAYTTKEDVAGYIHLYGHLPSNFITKKEAEKLGWEGGSLEPYAPGMCIGGNRFGNYEGILPDKKGRSYTECDIDTLGTDKRGAKRIVFSNDGLIYYTEDHYNTFELLYGEPEEE